MKSSNINETRDVVPRYKKKYAIRDSIEITQEMVLHHWNLEKALAQQLRASNPENRWKVFERCYSTLYTELDWLNQFVETDHPINPGEKYAQWVQAIGPAPQKVYEIGSGKGEMINYLAGLGYECRATEITSERGQKHISTQSNLTWASSDGVHLEKFEPSEFYDCVLSADVIEHMHPDDLVYHFLGVQRILKPGGSYIVATPHRFFGPSDISSIFGISAPEGMHLKEYTIYELVKVCREAGFSRIQFPLPVFSPRYHRLFFSMISDEVVWVCFLERLLMLLPRKIRNKFLYNKRLFPIRKIFLLIQK